jgi:hypothetical protein
MLRFFACILVVTACADLPGSCPHSLAQTCDSGLPCPTTWAAAQDPASWGGCNDRTSENNPILLGTCKDVTVAQMWGVDAATNFYYDRTTGALIAITSRRAPSHDETCVAGDEQPAICEDPAPRSLCP